MCWFEQMNVCRHVAEKHSTSRIVAQCLSPERSEQVLRILAQSIHSTLSRFDPEEHLRPQTLMNKMSETSKKMLQQTCPAHCLLLFQSWSFRAGTLFSFVGQYLHTET